MRRSVLLGLIFVAVFFVAGVVALTIAVPKFTSALRNTRETSAVKAITTIHTAQVQYFSSYDHFATSLQELGPPADGREGPAAAGLIAGDLAGGEKGGYRYTVQGTPTGYNVIAMPSQYGTTGSRTFFSDQGMKIHQHIGEEPATPNDPLLGE